MTKSPVKLYLDSSDYSVLSDPKREALEAPGVLKNLREHIDAGRVECFFSGTHLSEMAPLKSEYVDAAERRASLLVELCGKNVFISYDRLVAHEVRRALGFEEISLNPVNREGDWFPEGTAEMLPITEIKRAESMHEVMQELNRADRRKAKKALFKGGKPKPSIKQRLVDNSRIGSLDEILSIYPMNPESARVLSRFVSGDATAAEATDAFRESLRDPRWMMKWFEQHHGKLTPFITWMREPAQDIINQIEKLSKYLADARMRLSPDDFAEFSSAKQWDKWQDDLVTNIANRFSLNFCAEAKLTTEQIDKFCFGLSVSIRSVHSAWRRSTLDRPRQAKLSDFPDAIHAAYAPYTDIFRADSFMAPYIAHQSKKYGTTVVPKLTGLPHAIESVLIRL